MSSRDGLGVIISGVGQSDVGRRLERSALSLTVQATLQALDDSGLDRTDIDGISTWPGAESSAPGFSGSGVWDVKDALGLDLQWFAAGPETAGQLGAIINAVAAIRAGWQEMCCVFAPCGKALRRAPAAARQSSARGASA